MDKSKLERFIAKYNLNGACESITLTVVDGKMSVRANSDDSNVICEVSSPTMGLEDGTYYIYGTAQLKALLGVLTNTLTVDVKKVGDVPKGIILSDDNTEVTFALADSSVIPPGPPTQKKTPIYTTTIKLDTQFATNFSRAKSAIKDSADDFVVSSKGKDETADVVLGQSSKNVNRVKLKAVTTEAVELSPVRFSAKYLREILAANKDAQNGELQICSAGIARTSFEADGITSVYYLFKVDETD